MPKIETGIMKQPEKIDMQALGADGLKALNESLRLNASEAETEVETVDYEQEFQHKLDNTLEVISWSSKQFESGLVMTSSFGAQAALMLHLCTRVVPDIPVILIDTGYLFPETYQFAKEMTDRMALNLYVFQSDVSPARMEATMGRMWEEPTVEKLEQYDLVRKVEPLKKAFKDLRSEAWLSGVRAKQTSHRSQMKVIERHFGHQLWSIHPILNWSTRDVHNYLSENELPYHPLYYKGYLSIGDTHSTRAITEGEDERAGRFHGLKSECGIHMPESPEENQSMGSAGL